MTGITWAEWRALINTALALGMLAVGYIAIRQHPDLWQNYRRGLQEWRQADLRQPVTESAPPYATSLFPGLNLRGPNELAALPTGEEVVSE